MTRLQAVQCGDVLLTVRLSPGMTPSTGMRRWPVGGWAGPSPTRSSTCSCTGEENRAVFLWIFVDADDGGAFRTNTAAVTGQYQFPDDRPGDEDAFAREPFVVRFRAPKTGESPPASMNTFRCDRWMFNHLSTAIKEFVLIPQHTAPANTTKELQALYQVLQDVRTMWRTEVSLQSELQV